MTVQVVAGLIFHRNRLLIAQRPVDRHLGGYWEFPGGKVENGEELIIALRRELKEELAIEVKVHGLMAEVTHTYPEKTVQISFFACSWSGGTIQLVDCAAIAWVTQSELGSFSFPEADRELLVKLSQQPSWWDTKDLQEPMV